MAQLANLVYLCLLLLGAPWLAFQAMSKGKYRQGLAAKLLGLVPRRSDGRRCIWLHAVSVGEVNLLLPLVAEIARRHPDWQCVVSSTTLTGYTLARQRFAGLTVFYCPLDFSWAVRRTVARLQPDLLVLAELELWPNLIAAARHGGARVAIINGRLSDRSFRGYRRLRLLIAPVLRQLDLIAAQTPEYGQRFLALGARPESVHVTGSVKFDGAVTDRGNAETVRLARLAGFATSDVIFLAGSTQEPEEVLALAAWRRWAGEFPRLRLVIVPRHVHRFEEVARLLMASGERWQRRSELETAGADPQARILLVDKIGELKAWWGTARIAFVGGSLGSRGGQNMIEPAAYGSAVAFGPCTHNFRDVVAALLHHQAAVVVNDGGQLSAFVGRMLTEPQFAAELGQRANQVVAANLGATARTVDLLECLVNGAEVQKRTAA